MHRRALNPWSELEGQERQVLLRTPLVTAVCQVNFPTKLRAVTDEVAGAFQDRIDKRYPILNKVDVEGWELLASPGRSAQARDLPLQRTRQFSDPLSDWVTSLSAESISLECRTYQHFGEFVERLQEILTACIETVVPTIVTRIGLRYINEIRLSSPTDTSRLLRPEFLGPLAVSQFLESTESSIQSMQLTAGEGAKINLNHGFFTDGTTARPRNAETTVSGPFYLVDIDAYRVFDGRAQKAISTTTVVDAVEQFHDTISRIFWWSVTEEFVERAQVQ